MLLDALAFPSLSAWSRDRVSLATAAAAGAVASFSSLFLSLAPKTAQPPKRQTNLLPIGWLGSRVVSVLDSGAEGPGFKSQSRCCRVTVLGKLFTPIVPLFTKQRNW